MRIFFQEMMLDHPGMVVAEPVGGFQLRQRVLVEPEFVAGLPRARQLQLIEDSEFHDVAPAARLLFSAVYSGEGPSPASANSAARKKRRVRVAGTATAALTRAASFPENERVRMPGCRVR